MRIVQLILALVIGLLLISESANAATCSVCSDAYLSCLSSSSDSSCRRARNSCMSACMSSPSDDTNQPNDRGLDLSGVVAGVFFEVIYLAVILFIYLYVSEEMLGNRTKWRGNLRLICWAGIIPVAACLITSATKRSDAFVFIQASIGMVIGLCLFCYFPFKWAREEVARTSLMEEGNRQAQNSASDFVRTSNVGANIADLGSKLAEMTVEEVVIALGKSRRSVLVLLRRRGLKCADYDGVEKSIKKKSESAS